MTLYITTIGKTVYFPNKEFIEKRERDAIFTLAHEYLHIKDNQRLKAAYPIIYLLPQLLALLSVFSFFSLWFLLFLVFLLPIPSIGRKYIELRGYKMTLYMIKLYLQKNNASEEHTNKVLKKAAGQLNRAFVNSAYYWMWPFGVKNKLLQFIELIHKDHFIYDKTGAFERVKIIYMKD